jgi:hypothetical protein
MQFKRILLVALFVTLASAWYSPKEIICHDKGSKQELEELMQALKGDPAYAGKELDFVHINGNRGYLCKNGKNVQ